ncbi:MAG: NAD(P)H-hydrate dehydratase [Candidatus Micrarchaeota archaeon]
MENEIKARGIIKRRHPRSRKGENGRLVVIGGSTRYYGAPALVSLAAMRVGADLVYTLVPERIAPTVASYSPDLIVWGYSGDSLNPSIYPFVKELSLKADSLVIGNGLTREHDVKKTAQRVVNSWEKPIVLDADAIGALETPEGRTVYTPHDNEFLRLTGKCPPDSIIERTSIVKHEARKIGATILLKGAIDVISDGERTHTNRTGNAAMTCGGTGDVLAGIVGAFLSQGYSPFDAARIGAYVNGLAGDIAYDRFGYSMRATDVLDTMPSAIQRIHGRSQK